MKYETVSQRSAVQSGEGALSEVETRGVWRRFFHTCRVARIPYVLLLVYILANMGQSALLVRIPQISGNLFATGDVSVPSIALFLGAEVASTAIGMVANYLNQRFRLKTNRNLRNVLWGKILKVKPRYYDKVSASTLISRITVDTDSLNAFVLDIALAAVFSVYTLILTIREMSAISLRAACMLLAFVPLSLLIAFVVGRLNLKIENALKFKLADLTSYLSELLASLPVVKAFNQQDYECRRGGEVIDSYYAADRSRIFLDIGRQIIGALAGVLPEIVLILMGIRMLRESSLTPAGFYMFYVYSRILLSFVSTMGGYWQQSKAIQGQLNRVSEVLFEEEEAVDTYVEEAAASGDICFDGVTFRYGGTTALDRVSFTIPKNQTTALVGYSGSGKTTALKLLERIYDPDEGRILAGGRALTEYNAREWRSRIAFVPQNAPLLSGTIRENITYGIGREVSDEEIMEAARLVYADRFILESPEGLSRQVGQFGSKLSGGQRQKISIARALLAQAELIILDEPTASLDIIAADEVAKAIESIRHKATIVMIAHQPRILRGADHVVVLDKAHTAVESTHEELMETNGFYARLMQE